MLFKLWKQYSTMRMRYFLWFHGIGDCILICRYINPKTKLPLDCGYNFCTKLCGNKKIRQHHHVWYKKAHNVILKFRKSIRILKLILEYLLLTQNLQYNKDPGGLSFFVIFNILSSNFQKPSGCMEMFLTVIWPSMFVR